MRYIVGQYIEIPLQIVDSDTKVLVDPDALTSTVIAPDGTQTQTSYPPSTQNLDRDSVGEYVLNFEATLPGRWHWRLETTGPGEGASQGFVDVEAVNADTYRPTVDEIATRTYARTLDADGNQGSYSDTTRPTADQVDSLIDDALAVVQAAVGADLPVGQQAAAKYAVICRTAMAIERGLYPEATGTDDSAYRAWADEYTAAVAAVTTGVDQDQPNQSRIGSVPVSGGDSPCRVPGTEIPGGWPVGWDPYRWWP